MGLEQLLYKVYKSYQKIAEVHCALKVSLLSCIYVLYLYSHIYCR